MNIQMTLATRYLAGRKLRTALTTLAIMFGVLIIFGMNIMLPSFVQAFQANVMAASGRVDASLTLKSSDGFAASQFERVAAVDGVQAASPVLNRTINVSIDYFDQDPARTDAISSVSLVGIDPERANTLHVFPIKEGRFLEENEPGAAVISQSLAEAIGLQLNQSFTLPAARGESTLTVVGILPARAMPGDEEIFVTLPQAQAMFDMADKINTIEVNFDSLDEGRRTEIENAILNTLGDAYQIGTLASNSELLTNLKVGQTIFTVLGVLALLMGGFIIFNTFRTIVAERRRDIGMLRALGATRATILGTILTEGLVQGVIGTAFGLAAGYLLARGMVSLINPVFQRYMNTQVGSLTVSAGLVLTSIAIGVGVTLLAGLLPAMSASRLTPLEAIRPRVAPITLKRMVGLGFWSGVGMIALAVAALVTRNPGLIGLGGALFVLGLILAAPALVNPIANLFSALLAVIFARSGTAQLAEGNLSRQPTRAAITASTTLIGMAIVVMAAALFTSVEIGFGKVMRKSLGSDYLLIPPSIAVWGTNVGASTQFAESLRQVDGVATVSGLRYAPSRVGDAAITVMGIDPAYYPQVSGLTFTSGEADQAYTDLTQGRNIIINGVLSSLTGIKMGDAIELATANGIQTYHVVGVGIDYLNAKIATGYISHASIATDFARNEDVLIQLNLDPAADRQTAEVTLKSALRDYPQFRLISGQDYIEENLEIFNAAFAGIFAMVIFLSVPSLIAMINTLAIGVIERTREIGMLRAVGATRRQVRTMIVAEALILSAIGTGFGVLAGMYLGYMTVQAMSAAGFPMEYAFPAAGVLVAIAAGLFFGVLAAVIPARQAARLEIVQALRYE